jgi:hypothetical protein
VRVTKLEVRHKPLLLAPICLTQSASEHSIHLHLHSKARIHLDFWHRLMPNAKWIGDSKRNDGIDYPV